MKQSFVIASTVATAVAMVVSLAAQNPAQGPAAQAAKPRGATAPPEQSAVKPVNFLPNPYETVRNFGPLPNGRTWG